MKAKELFEILKPLFLGGVVEYKELRYDSIPEWNRDVITIKGFHTCYYEMGSSMRDLVIEFDPASDTIKEFGLD